MKRILKIMFFSLLAVIVIGAAAVCIFQWDNIQAAIVGLKYSEEDIDRMKVDAKTDFSEKTGIDLDVIEAMAANMTPEGTLIDSNVGSPAPDERDSDASHKDENIQLPAVTEPTPGKNPVRDTSRVEAILARFYALQNSYVSQIEGIKSNAYAQYKALPKAERGTSAKIRLGRAAVSQATALESECDAKITSLLKELRIALQEVGLDQSVASDVEYYYASEKSLLKAQYMSKYKKYLSP